MAFLLGRLLHGRWLRHRLRLCLCLQQDLSLPGSCSNPFRQLVDGFGEFADRVEEARNGIYTIFNKYSKGLDKSSIKYAGLVNIVNENWEEARGAFRKYRL